MAELTFKPPGPGTWQLEEAHFSKPFSRWMQAVFPPAMAEGFGQAMAHYGMLLDEPAIEAVHGFIYISMRPVVGPAEADNPPPKWLFTLMKYVHPTLRRRLSRIEDTFERRRWREDLERWDEEWMPERVAENRSLQAVDPTDLDDAELADHLVELRDVVADGIVLHHRMDLCPLLPLGDFLVHAQEWTDRDPGELLGLFQGASPISAGALDELRAVATAIEKDPAARETLFAQHAPGVILDRLQAGSGSVEEALAEWLNIVGYRITSGYDVADAYALEMPSALVATLRNAVKGDIAPSTPNSRPVEFEAIREEVPVGHREMFDDLYEEARLTYRVRDERSLTDLWTIGLARRSILEAGQRLAARGALHDAEHAVDLRPDELVSGLRGNELPDPNTVAGYVDHRRSHDIHDAPSRLGPEAPPPPPEDWLPESAARAMRATEMILQHLNEPNDAVSAHDRLHGLGASAGTVEGPVRIVSGPDDFADITDGDILVADSTSPAFNVILPLLGGIVTDNGGVLSHAAIVSREYGIPGVVGCTDATARLETGTRVVVDGDAGTVEILG